MRHRLTSSRPPIRTSGSKPRIAVHPGNRKIRMPREQAGQRALVFLRGKGAGGIGQPPARAHQLHRFVQDFILPGRAQGGRAFVPFARRIFILSEHALTRTGCVYHDAVKRIWKTRCEPRRRFVRHRRIANPRPLDALRQDFGACGVDFIGNQNALPLHASGQMGGFPAGRGA